MDDQITKAIDIGLQLKKDMSAEIKWWRSGARKPSSSSIDLEALYDLEVQIERWFNEVDFLVRDSLSYDKNAMLDAFRALTNPWGKHLRYWAENVNKNKEFESVLDDFEIPIRLLRSVPKLSKQTAASDLSALTLQPNTAFILMWMNRERPELEDVSSTFKEVFDEFGIKAKRADDIEHQDVITDVILKHIRESEFLIADLSGERPNVYYEIGYAHAIGKRPILYRKQGTPLHFDLPVHNVPEYSDITELNTLLRKRLEAMTGKQLVSRTAGGS